MIGRNISCKTDVLENLVMGDKALVKHAGQDNLEASVFMNDPFLCEVTILNIDGIVDLKYEDVVSSFRSLPRSISIET